MSYAFQSPRAQVSSTLPRANDDYTHDPYSADPQHQYAPCYSQQDHDHYRDDLGDSHDSNPARTLHRDHQQSYDDDHHYSDTRAGASAIDDHNMSAEKGNYGSPYAAKRASGNSIWTKDDKRAFSSRSCPAKFFRILIGNLILAIIFIVSIILLIVMFLRPPNVGISGVSVPNQNAVSYQNGAFSFNVTVDISVSNPNSISANIKKLSATAYDSADQSTALGHGLVTNQAIRANANTTVEFPFQIRYSQSEDPDFSIIQNIASDCGLTGGSGGGDLSFLFKVQVDVEVLSITVPVNINRNISFPCPLSASSLQGVLSGLGGSLGNILGGGGSAGRRAITEGAESDDGIVAAFVRRHFAKSDEIDMSSVELVAAVADGLARRYAPTPKDEGKRSLADEHDAL